MTDREPERAQRAEALMRKHSSVARRGRMATTIVIVVAAIGAISAAAYFASNTKGSSTSDTAPRHATDDYGFTLTPSIATGKKVADPPVTVTLYEDFLCPSCRIFEENSAAYLDKAVTQGKISITYKPFAFLVGASTNRYSERAANAAACVADTAGVAEYAAFHDLLYANQPKENTAGPDDAALVALAKKAGASKADACIKDEKFASWIADALKAGKDAGVKETPTVAVNDSVVRVFGDSGDTVIPGPADLKRAIAQAS